MDDEITEGLLSLEGQKAGLHEADLAALNLAQLFGRLPELAAQAATGGDARLRSLFLDALEAAPEALAVAGVRAAIDANGLLAGGALAPELRGLARRLPWRGVLAAAVLGVSERHAARLLSGLYPGRARLSLAELAAAHEVQTCGGPGWLRLQQAAWDEGRGRAVPEALLPLALAQRPRRRLPEGLWLVQAPGLDSEQVSLVRGLMRRSAAELRAAYRLAARLSAILKAPVITLHNATLGGYSAWGMPGFAAQAAGSGLAREAERLAAGLAAELGLGGGLVAEVAQRHREQFLHPRLTWLLSALREICEAEGDAAAYPRWLALARPYLIEAEPRELAFPFRPRDEIEAALERTLAGAQAEAAACPERLRLAAALWLAGRGLMQQGKLASLVIPVADKFVASSSRGLAVAYLAAWARALLCLAPEARCLLFDASPNPAQPSLRFAPERLREEGVAALGLGIFSEEGSLPQTVAGLRRHEGARLFLLEPLPCPGRRGAERLREADATLLTPSGYDPAWKEALPWLTAGSSLAGLADPWLPPPPAGGLVLSNAGPLPGGTLYLQILRRVLRGALKPSEPSGRSREAALWRRWVRLARLA